MRCLDQSVISLSLANALVALFSLPSFYLEKLRTDKCVWLDRSLCVLPSYTVFVATRVMTTYEHALKSTGD